MSQTVTGYDPILNILLFFGMGLTAIAFLLNSIMNFQKFNNAGKILAVLSILPLIALIVYGVGSGYYADEIARTENYYVQHAIGSGKENEYLILSCLLNILANMNVKPGK